MILSEYHAAVECRGVFQPLDSCSTIMDDMETSKDSLTFGPSGDPDVDVQVPIPLVMNARKAPFTFFVFLHYIMFFYVFPSSDWMLIYFTYLDDDDE